MSLSLLIMMLNIYGEEKVLKAFNGEIVEVDKKYKFDYNQWATKKNLISKGNCLLLYTDTEGNNIIDITNFDKFPIWSTSFHNIFFWIILLLGGFLIGIKKDSIREKLRSIEIREISLLFYSIITLCISMLVGYHHIDFFNLYVFILAAIIGMVIVFLGYLYWGYPGTSFVLFVFSLGWFIGISIYLESFYPLIITISAISLGLFIGRGYFIISSIPKYFRAIPRHFEI